MTHFVAIMVEKYAGIAHLRSHCSLTSADGGSRFTIWDLVGQSWNISDLVKQSQTVLDSQRQTSWFHPGREFLLGVLLS